MFGNANPFPLFDSFLESFQPKGRRFDIHAARQTGSRQFTEYDMTFAGSVGISTVFTITAGATATNWAVLAQAGGWIRGVTGASVATGSLQLSIPQKYWDGTRGAGFASLIRVSDETEVRIEQGFADVLPAINTTVVNSLVSATFNSVTTGAVYVYDHVSGAGTTTGLYCIGASTTGNKVATTTNRYASGTTLFTAIEVNGRTARLWLGTNGGTLVATATNGTNAAPDAWLPFVAVKTSTATKNIDIDALWTWSLSRV